RTLQDRQRIHVGAQADGALRNALFQGTDNAGSGISRLHRQPEFDQQPRDEGGGLVLLIRQFRNGMEMAPPRDSLPDEIRRHHGICSFVLPFDHSVADPSGSHTVFAARKPPACNTRCPSETATKASPSSCLGSSTGVGFPPARRRPNRGTASSRLRV